MENTTRLLERQADLLSQRSVLVVDANDPALASLPCASLHLHADDFTVGAQQWAPAPTLPDGVDLLVLPLPKSIERLRFLLDWLAGEISGPCELWLLGPSKGGIRGALKYLEQHVDAAELVDSARHCKLYRGMLQPGERQSLAVWGSVIPCGELEAVSYPGVFSHGRLDEGTRMLLAAMDGALPAPGRALDLGCGAGLITLSLARQGWQMQAVDVSAAAVAASCHSLERNGLQGRVMGGDLYSPVSGRVDVIVTNPPFHEGRQRTTGISQRLIELAPSHLQPGGVLWLVANRELPYMQWLEQAFAKVQIVTESNRFRVYRASL
ncbi:MAG: methyltransferase [Alcanivorax sp.]|nr:methyltransferase [Alcanivorax sp.]